MTDKKFPTPEEVQREFEDFVRQRFGGSVQVITNHVTHRDAAPAPHPQEAEEAEGKFDVNFNLTPKEVKNFLDKYVIKQDDAKKALAIAICDHYNHVKNCLRQTSESKEEYSKQNVLILGPTGVGKTYLVRKIAELIGVPFVKADATRFSETGYVGANVDDLVRDLVTQANGDIQKAQYGIVYLDEADKIASAGNLAGRDVNGRGVQFGLLRLMEEAEVDLKSGNDMRSQMQMLLEMQRGGKPSKSVVSTANILFIVSGAFTGLEEIIRKRVSTNAIGFATDKQRIETSDDIFQYAVTEDFIKFGFEPEFIGRLPVRVSCQHLTTQDLYHILKESKGSITKQYVGAFQSYGIQTSFTDWALLAVAEKASHEKTGARALMTVCENTLREFKFELPSTLIQHFVITEELIRNPKAILAMTLKEADKFQSEQLIEDLRAFERSFLERTKITLRFDDEASHLVVQECAHSGAKVGEYCGRLLQSYEHGLKLIRQSNGLDSFILPKEVVTDPQSVLEKFIHDCFRSGEKKAKEAAGPATPISFF